MKPTVFNYQEYEKVVEENKKLKAEVANLLIRCRIAESEKPDRDCKSCKHNKPDGCSRWDCEYEPVMSDLISRQDAIEAIKTVLDDGGEWFIEAVNDIPSAGQNCVLCEYYTEIETDDGINGKCIRRTGSDLISRQDVYHILEKTMIDRPLDSDRWVIRDIDKAIRSLPSAEPLVLTCDGCRHVGTYDTDFPCSVCIRREKDYYEQER